MSPALFAAAVFACLGAAPAFAAPPPLPGGTVPIRPGFHNAVPPVPQFGGAQNQNLGDGIYSHQVYSASSPDGLSWTRDGVLVFDHASVPEAAIAADGTIFLYFMDASGRGHRMSVATSKDSGKTWDKKEVAIAGRKTTGHAVDPNVVILPDGTFRLFYLGTFGPPKPGAAEEHGIYSALSTDGVNFTEEAGVRFAKRARITDPDTVPTGQGWKMFVSEGPTNWLTTSADGMTFTAVASPASTEGAVSKTVAMDGGFRTYRCSHRGGIVSQFTQDFLTWTDEGMRLKAENGEVLCDPSVIRLPDGTYKMYFKTMPAGFSGMP